MKPVPRVLRLGACVLAFAAGTAAPLLAQDGAQAEQGGGRAFGLRAGSWNVPVRRVEQAIRSPLIEGYYERSLGGLLALENSLAVWRVKTTVQQPLPGARVVESRTYIAPLLTSLKLYPLAGADYTFQPYLLGGLGFAFGVEDESENAIGGGGTTVVTGLAVRGAIGVEMQLGGPLAIAAAGKYQWAYFGEELIGMNSFGGLGVEGAVTYRVPF